MSTLGQAQLIISADDQTGAAFTSIEKRVEQLGAMVNKINQVGASVARVSGAVARRSNAVSRLSEVQARASTVQRALSGVGNMGSYIAASALGVGSIYAAKEVAEKIIRESAARQHERVRMEVYGMSASEMMDAEGTAAALASKYKPVAQTDIMHMLRNARSIVGSYEEAGKIMDPLLALRVTALGSHPGNQELEADFDKLIKGLEIKGITQNLPKFREYMDGMAKAINVFGDTLRPTDYYEMFKYGRQSTQGLSEDYMLSVAPTLAQELGGSSAGKANSAFYTAIVGGKMTVAGARALQELGLVDSSKIMKGKGGDLAKLKPGAIEGSALAAMNPYAWVNQILLPAMAKKGIVNPQKIQEVIATVFTNSVGAQLASIFSTQQSRIEKDRALISGAKGLSAAEEFMKKDPEIAWQSLKNAFSNASVEVLGGGENLAAILNGTASTIEAIGITLKKAREQQGAPDMPDDYIMPAGLGGIVLKKSDWAKINNDDPDQAQNKRAAFEDALDNSDSVEAGRNSARLKKMADDRESHASWWDINNPWGIGGEISDMRSGAQINDALAKSGAASIVQLRADFEASRKNDYAAHPFLADQIDRWNTQYIGKNMNFGQFSTNGTKNIFTPNAWDNPEHQGVLKPAPNYDSMPWPPHAEPIPDIKNLFGPNGAQVSLDPNSKASVEITIKVDPSSDLFKILQQATAKSSGNIDARLGPSMTEAAPKPRGPH